MAVDPGSRSPGHLFLQYNDRGLDHTCSVALVDGVDIQLVTALETDATELAGYVAACLPPSCTITGWGVRPAGGGPTYTALFDPALPGTHSFDASFPAFYSATVTVMGRSAGTGVGAARGNTRIVLFTSNAYVLTPGELVMTGVLPAAIASLMFGLSSSTRYFADSYGQKADPTGRVTVQFNAMIQKSKGL